jgi:hypothetical protein
MKRVPTSKRFTAVAAVALAALAAVGAYAYVIANGTGTGTASVGSDSGVTVGGTTSGTLYPGSSVPVSFTVDNLSTASQRVGTVYLAGVKACTGAGSSWDRSLGGGAGGCSNTGTEETMCESVDPGEAADADARNFYMADVSENQDVAGSSTGVALAAGGTLEMNNLSSAQDSCQNASVVLELRTR